MDPLAIGHSRLFQRGSRDFAKQRNRTQSAAMRISGAIDFNAPVLNYARKDFPLLEADASVEKALEAIRREGIGERVIYFYAIDERKHLVGVVPTRRLLTAAPNTLLREIMVPRVISYAVFCLKKKKSSDTLLIVESYTTYEQQMTPPNFHPYPHID